MSESPESPPVDGVDEQPQDEQAFTQADVDRIVRERIKREREKYADYDDLKAKAEGAKTVEQQLAELKAELNKSRRDAAAARIAGQYGISAEVADLLLTGNDEDTLTAQAKALADEAAKKDANRRRAADAVPSDRGNPSPTPESDHPMRQVLREMGLGKH